jgi:galactokinase
MDQFISCFGEKDKALMLDCRSLEYRLMSVDPAARIVVCNSMVKHELAAGEYNTRRSECEEGVRLIRRRLPGTTALRDVSSEQWADCGSSLPEVLARRCRHVISENDRVVGAAAALDRNDLEEFGRLMYRSHESLRRDYEVSCRELDVLVDLARGIDGVYGARMTGGGFGGCTVNLVCADEVERFAGAIIAGYRAVTGIVPAVLVCTAAAGATEVTSGEVTDY